MVMGVNDKSQAEMGAQSGLFWELERHEKVINQKLLITEYKDTNKPVT